MIAMCSPVYLLIPEILKQNLNTSVILGMTGSITKSAQTSLCELLSIDYGGGGVISSPIIRDTLHLSLSYSDEKYLHPLFISILERKICCGCFARMTLCTCDLQ